MRSLQAGHHVPTALPHTRAGSSFRAASGVCPLGLGGEESSPTDPLPLYAETFPTGGAGWNAATVGRAHLLAAGAALASDQY